MQPTGPYFDSAEIKDWLQLVSQDDQAAFTRLLRLFWNKVYTQALTYLKSSHRAQEITQDVFLKIWSNRKGLAGVDNFSSYLFIIARNETISALRKKREAFTEPDELAEEALWIPDLQLQYKESYTLLLKGIEALPPARRHVFKLSRFENLSYEEIAQSLRISRNGVKDHIVKALLFLRNYLREHSGEALLLLLLLNKMQVQSLTLVGS